MLPTSSVNDLVSLKCQPCPDSVPRDAPGAIGTAVKFFAHAQAGTVELFRLVEIGPPLLLTIALGTML